MRHLASTPTIALLCLGVALGLASFADRAKTQAEVETHFEGMRSALRIGHNMRADGTLRVKQRRDAPMGEPAPFDEWSVDITLVRRVSEGLARTFIHTRDPDVDTTDAEHISLLVQKADGTLSQSIWQQSQRRFIVYNGIRAGDEVLNSLFRFEDLFLTPKTSWASGHVVETNGQALVVEATPQDGVPRIVVRLDPQSELPTSVLSYDRAGQRTRELTWTDVQTVGARPHPMRTRVFDHLTREEAELVLDRIVFDDSLADRALEPENLSRRLRRGLAPLPEAGAALPRTRGFAASSASVPQP